MKAIIFILLMCGFYYGMNQYALSEDALERWITSTQFPNQESADKFCEAMEPLTEVNLDYVVNISKTKTVNSTEALCVYMRDRIIAGASKKNTGFKITNLNINRIQKFPFNSATATVNVEINTYTKHKEIDRYTGNTKTIENNYHYKRAEKITFKRTFLGDYKILSFSGTADVSIPERNN